MSCVLWEESGSLLSCRLSCWWRIHWRFGEATIFQRLLAAKTHPIIFTTPTTLRPIRADQADLRRNIQFVVSFNVRPSIPCYLSFDCTWFRQTSIVLVCFDFTQGLNVTKWSGTWIEPFCPTMAVFTISDCCWTKIIYIILNIYI